MNFDRAFDLLIGHEGGYVNNPADPGGETNFGISARAYPNLNIKELTREKVRPMYLTDFWQRVHGDEFPLVAFHGFDFAVNSGVETAIRYMQRAIGVADDGHWGPVTIAALRNQSATDVIMLLTAERLDFMTKLSNWPNASRGWVRRMAMNLRIGAEET